MSLRCCLSHTCWEWRMGRTEVWFMEWGTWGASWSYRTHIIAGVQLHGARHISWHLWRLSCKSDRGEPGTVLSNLWLICSSEMVHSHLQSCKSHVLYSCCSWGWWKRKSFFFCPDTSLILSCSHIFTSIQSWCCFLFILKKAFKSTCMRGEEDSY